MLKDKPKYREIRFNELQSLTMKIGKHETVPNSEIFYNKKNDVVMTKSPS